MLCRAIFLGACARDTKQPTEPTDDQLWGAYSNRLNALMTLSVFLTGFIISALCFGDGFSGTNNRTLEDYAGAKELGVFASVLSISALLTAILVFMSTNAAYIRLGSEGAVYTVRKFVWAVGLAELLIYSSLVVVMIAIKRSVVMNAFGPDICPIQAGSWDAARADPTAMVRTGAKCSMLGTSLWNAMALACQSDLDSSSRNGTFCTPSCQTGEYHCSMKEYFGWSHYDQDMTGELTGLDRDLLANAAGLLCDEPTAKKIKHGLCSSIEVKNQHQMFTCSQAIESHLASGQCQNAKMETAKLCSLVCPTTAAEARSADRNNHATHMFMWVLGILVAVLMAVRALAIISWQALEYQRLQRHQQEHAKRASAEHAANQA